MDLPQVDLPQVELPQVDLPQVELPQVELPQIDLQQVDLSEEDLSEEDLPQVDLPQVDLWGISGNRRQLSSSLSSVVKAEDTSVHVIPKSLKVKRKMRECSSRSSLMARSTQQPVRRKHTTWHRQEQSFLSPHKRHDAGRPSSIRLRSFPSSLFCSCSKRGAPPRRRAKMSVIHSSEVQRTEGNQRSYQQTDRRKGLSNAALRREEENRNLW